MNDEKLTVEQREALRQKQSVLNNGQYTPIPHWIYRELLPELTAKYDGQTARDCLTLYMYVHAYVNGQSEGSAYMWAYPNVKKSAKIPAYTATALKDYSTYSCRKVY